MKSFLQYIVDDLGPADITSFKDKCFVFPSRRAAIYFGDLLQKKYADSTFWAPDILSIEEFVQQNTPKVTVVDDVSLLFKLYEVYKKEEPHIVFDTFYAWGQTLLNDFDEIDRYLIDAQLLYKNLQEVEDIEATFGPSEEVINAIKGFKEVIDNAEESDLWKKFNKTWTTVGKVYQQFKEALAQEGWAYNGLCYRQLAQGLSSGEITLSYTEVVFSGFNAISASEEKIIDNLLNKGIAKVYIDADKFYLDNEDEEAGFFLRKMRKHWRQSKQVNWVITDGFKQPKKINIIGVAQKTGQAKAAAKAIENDSKNTAIALADESLLMPVLYALPEQETDLNITMGYPVDGTATGGLAKSFMKYQATGSTNKAGQTYFDIEAYDNLLRQPAIAGLISNRMSSLSHSKSRYMSWQAIRASIDETNKNYQPVLMLLFSPVTGIKKAVETISQAILSLYLLTKDEDSRNLLEEQVVAALVKYLQNLQGILGSTSFNIGFNSLEKLIGESIKQLSTPFSGEPLANLQVMGFLETRALDFENLVVLSLNEDILPASGGTKTYIPFGMRKAFKLPTFLEHNSIYAYHFFRLLQRAKNITLIYNTKLSVTGSGEKSRFILQLLKHFNNEPSVVEIKHNSLLPQLPHNTSLDDALVFDKTGVVLDKLNEHFNSFTKDKPLSPTSLVDYITCSLKYYFARILRIREAEEPSAEIDARDFGNILHNILETTYTTWIGKEITKPDLQDILKNQLSSIVDDAFEEYDTDVGEVSFTRHIILHLARRILENDIKDTPIKIVDLESRKNPLVYNLPLGEGKTIPLGGKIDRLDQILIDEQWVTRILDYKTGKFNLKSKSVRNKELSVEDYMTAYFTDPKYKSGLQIYFYTLLHKRLNPDKQITGGIIGVNKINKGVEYLRQQRAALEDEVIAEFENKLAQLINEMRNPDKPFVKTEDSKRCLYCEFKTICER